MQHPREIGAAGVEEFLTMLATERKVCASTHYQVLSAILFLYREVLAINLPWLKDIDRPTQKRRIPSVLTKDEVAGSVLAHMDGQTALKGCGRNGKPVRFLNWTGCLNVRFRCKEAP